MAVWHVRADWGNLDLFQKLWKWTGKELTTEEINNELL